MGLVEVPIAGFLVSPELHHNMENTELLEHKWHKQL